MTQNIIPDKDFPDYTAFSASLNPIYFKLILPLLNPQLKEECPLYACKEHFEELVNESYELQVEYVEHYHIENEYFITQSFMGDVLMDLYFIVKQDEIVMFFIRKSP